MGEGVEIPIKLTELDKAQKGVEGLRTSVRNFFEDMKKQDTAAGRAISTAAGTVFQQAAGAGAYAFGASGGGFQQGMTAAAKAGVSAIPGALTAAGGMAGGPAGAAAGMLAGSAIAGGLDRAIDNGDFQALGIEGVARRNARGRVAEAAGAAGRFGVQFSDAALQRAIKFAEGFEQRGYAQQRRVLDMQVWR